MKRTGLVLALLFCTAMPALAQRLPPLPPPQKEGKSTFPTVILRAQFVKVVSQREADLNQEPDLYDYKAVTDLEAALRKWGRYKVVYGKEEADLIFSVRRVSTVPGLGGGPPRRTSTGIATEIASDGDQLAVYNGHTGAGGAALWRKGQKDGLAPPKMPLLKLFQEEVDAAAAKQP